MNHNKLILATFLILIFVSPNLYCWATEPYTPSKTSNTPLNYFSVNIMDTGQCTAKEFSTMLLFYNPVLNPEKVDFLAKIYIEESHKEGVNQDIAFSQMCLETGFLSYGGSVKPEQNNFCGLGATTKYISGEKFPDVQTGVRAHIQHLKAYASTNDLNHEVVDMRFRFVKRGTAQTIYELPGKWAADKDYAIKLEDLLNRLFQLRAQSNQQEFFNILR